MSKQTGYTCDNPGCTTFVVAETLPLGWLRLSVVATSGERDNVFELCSNRCLAILARERAHADGVSVPNSSTKGVAKRNRTEEGRAAQRANAYRTLHLRGKHEDVVYPDCPLCEQATEPVIAAEAGVGAT